jgi:hypothetical protein
VSVLVFEADGSLISWRRREVQRLLTLMVEPLDKATVALREASGISGAETEGPDPAKYLEPPLAV